MEKNKVLLIDMYGVIIKESKGYFIPYTFQHFPEAEYQRLTTAFKEDRVFSKAQKGELSNQEFLEYLEYENPRETMEDYLKNYLTLDEQFRDFASHISGRMKMCLLSNDVAEWSEFLTDYYYMNPYFDEKIVSGEVHLRKPDRAIFECALEKLKCKAKDCIFVDNSVKNLRVAEELGMETILFNRDGEEYEGNVVNNFVELGEMLRKFQ
ncbi:MAG: HAD-IA family hydrolase [Lachnospiraceae bacterium]|nr:HAD-IA family hydrolase [Lachnospiraceae bacterium]